jgi:hypothetical protein
MIMAAIGDVFTISVSPKCSVKMRTGYELSIDMFPEDG